MPSSPNQRLKLLYLMKILMEKTDEQNPMTIAEIKSALASYCVKAERKSLYADIELLCQFGIDIERQQRKTFGYYVAERQFELPELKLLVDAVQSSRFISEKKSTKLIQKLSLLTSSGQARQLHRQVFMNDRAKTVNEAVYYSIDRIHDAINQNKKIAFKYFDNGVDKKRIYRKQGGLYTASPVALCWNEDKYYLVAYNEKYDSFTHYRVDRMSGVEVLDAEKDAFDQSKWDIAKHTKRVFGMFDEGELVRARLCFDNCLVNQVLDQFGQDVLLIPAEDGWFEISVDVSISPVFLAWMFQFGEYAAILSPDSLIEAMQRMLEEHNRYYFDK